MGTSASAKIHPTAIVAQGAELGPGVEIGPFCTVGPNVKLGEGTKLLSHVVVDGWTQVGAHCTIFPFAVVGAVPQDLKYKGEKSTVTIGDHCTIRESVTINLGTEGGGGKTTVGHHTLLMAYTHLGHDCVVGNHVIIANACQLAGHVTVEDNANVGGHCGVSQFVRIGAHSYVGGFTAIEKDIPPFTVVVGSRGASLKGANIVGLRRRGFTAENIQKINEALKLWARPDVQKEQCLLEISSQYGEYAEIQQLVSFIRKSEYGVVR